MIRSAPASPASINIPIADHVRVTSPTANEITSSACLAEVIEFPMYRLVQMTEKSI